MPDILARDGAIAVIYERKLRNYVMYIAILPIFMSTYELFRSLPDSAR